MCFRPTKCNKCNKLPLTYSELVMELLHFGVSHKLNL